MADAHFRLVQFEIPVVEVSGPTLRAWAEICHYVAVYSQNGPCYIESLCDDEWTPTAV